MISISFQQLSNLLQFPHKPPGFVKHRFLVNLFIKTKAHGTFTRQQCSKNFPLRFWKVLRPDDDVVKTIPIHRKSTKTTKNSVLWMPGQ